MKRVCVIDNSTLVSLTRLHDLQIFNLLRSIFRSIHIPGKIYQEFEKMVDHEPERKIVLDQIRLQGSGFLVYCNKYDTIAFEFLKTTKGIDEGEAEAAAQHQSLRSHFVLSDDKKFINAIRTHDPNVRVFTCLHVMAWLDCLGFLSVPGPYFNKLHKRIRFTNSQLQAAYVDINNYLGFSLSKKNIYKKVSRFRSEIR